MLFVHLKCNKNNNPKKYKYQNKKWIFLLIINLKMILFFSNQILVVIQKHLIFNQERLNKSFKVHNHNHY